MSTIEKLEENGIGYKVVMKDGKPIWLPRWNSLVAKPEHHQALRKAASQSYSSLVELCETMLGACGCRTSEADVQELRDDLQIATADKAVTTLERDQARGMLKRAEGEIAEQAKQLKAEKAELAKAKKEIETLQAQIDADGDEIEVEVEVEAEEKPKTRRRRKAKAEG